MNVLPDPGRELFCVNWPDWAPSAGTVGESQNSPIFRFLRKGEVPGVSGHKAGLQKNALDGKTIPSVGRAKTPAES